MSGFRGYHSEWNLGSPGGWDYQRMAQVLGRHAWAKIKVLTGIEIELDFDSRLLDPLPGFAAMLLRAHSRLHGSEKPFVLLVAEKETLGQVGENIHLVEYLNALEGVSAVLASPEEVEVHSGRPSYRGREVTAMFLDFNNNVIVKLVQESRVEGIISAIKNGITVNPRGMEPVGAKGVFECITDVFRGSMSPSTVARTPWTRRLYQRRTTGPSGEEIKDLVEWTYQNWERLILKPVHGYSGKGIMIGYKDKDRSSCIDLAVKKGGYIVQELVPLSLWEEEYPWLDRQRERVFIKSWQTDFRCFVNDEGLMGFVTRFGGVPTNVGSGGGVQSTAILRSPVSISEATSRVNDAIMGIGYDVLGELQEELDRMSVSMGNVYILGPIMGTLRPRIILPGHVKELAGYASCLRADALKLVGLWEEGSLDEFVQISEEEEGIARMQPWVGQPALIASDGLFCFREDG